MYAAAPPRRPPRNQNKDLTRSWLVADAKEGQSPISSPFMLQISSNYGDQMLHHILRSTDAGQSVVERFFFRMEIKWTKSSILKLINLSSESHLPIV